MRVLAILLALSSVARAEYDVEREVPYIPPPVPEQVEPAPRTRWYGWQILLADLLAIPIAMRLYFFVEEDEDLRAPAIFAPFVASGSLVHLANGQKGKALTSAIGRTVPLAAIVVGRASDSLREPMTIVAVWTLLGFFIYDYSFHPVETERATRQSDGTWTFSAAPTPNGGAMAGVIGTF